LQSHGHCLLVADGAWVVGLVTLPDLQRAISSLPASPTAGSMPTLLACRRGDLVWLPETAHLAQLEDQLNPNGLRQLPVFALDQLGGEALPQGLPGKGLPLAALRGIASRDGMARALARQLSPALLTQPNPVALPNPATTAPQDPPLQAGA